MKKILTGLLSTTLLLSLITPTSQAKDVYFSDVESGTWYYSAVSDAAQRNFFTGYSNGTFLPDKQITGSEFAVVLCNAFYPSHFEMENENRGKDWAEPYINTLKAFATSGSAALTMNFDEVLTRAQAASLLYDAMVAHGFALMDGTGASNFLNSKFTSVADCSPYVTQIANVISAGYMSGFSENSFGGQASLTRAQAAVMIVNMDNSGLFTHDVGVRHDGIDSVRNLADVYTNGKFYITMPTSAIADMGSYYRIEGEMFATIEYEESYLDSLNVGDILSTDHGFYAGVSLSSPQLSHIPSSSSVITEYSYSPGGKGTSRSVEIVTESSLYALQDRLHLNNYYKGGTGNYYFLYDNSQAIYTIGNFFTGFYYLDTGYLILDKNTPFNSEPNPFIYSNVTSENMVYHDLASFFYKMDTESSLAPKLEITVENGVVTYINPYESQ